MKKILHVIGTLKTGGAENIAVNYIRYIDKTKFDVHYLVYDTEEGEYESEVVSLNGTIHRIYFSKKNPLKFIIDYLKLLKKEQFDIVHSHMMLHNGIIMLLSRIGKVPLRISHSHSTQFKVNTSEIYKIYSFIMKHLILHNSNKLLACGEDAGNFLYGEKKFTKYGVVVPNGINSYDFKFSDINRKNIRKKHKIEDETILVGHVGRLSKVKNQMFLLNIIKKLSNIVDNKYKLIIIGDGQEYQNLKLFIEKNDLIKDVMLIGNKKNVNEYLSAFDIFLLPSLYEGMPLSVVESQCNGLPTLISENVSDEIIITDLVKKLPIYKENSSDIWKHCIQNITLTVNRESYPKCIIQKGYDVRQIGNILEKIYLE